MPISAVCLFMLRDNVAMALQKLCKLEDVDDGQARGFELEIADQTLQIVCVRQADKLYTYKNSCPHTGVNLEWLPDQFLDDTQQYLVCSTHGALFQIEDGHCVAGPCAGESLQDIPTVQRAGVYCIEAGELL